MISDDEVRMKTKFQEENDMKKWMILAAAILVVLGIGFAVKGASDRKPDVYKRQMFDLPSRSDVAKVVVTPEVIAEGKEPTLVPGEPKRKLPAGKTRREGDTAAANRRPSVS